MNEIRDKHPIQTKREDRERLLLFLFEIAMCMLLQAKCEDEEV